MVTWLVAEFTWALVITGGALWAWTVGGLPEELHPDSTLPAQTRKTTDRKKDIEFFIASSPRIEKQFTDKASDSVSAMRIASPTPGYLVVVAYGLVCERNLMIYPN